MISKFDYHDEGSRDPVFEPIPDHDPADKLGYVAGSMRFHEITAVETRASTFTQGFALFLDAKERALRGYKEEAEQLPAKAGNAN